MNILNLETAAVEQFMSDYGIDNSNPVLCMSLDQLKVHKIELESKANNEMGENQLWDYSDLSDVNSFLCGKMIDVDAAIAKLERNNNSGVK